MIRIMAVVNIKIITSVLLCVLVLGNFNFARGSELNLNPESSLNLNPLDAVNRAGIGGINAGEVLDAFKFNFPFDLKNINIDTKKSTNPCRVPRTLT